jgi:outer membrane protein OmpA-like peptidoglycan-associated protein
MRWTKWLVGLVVAAVVAAGCGGGSAKTRAQTSAPESSDTTDAAAAPSSTSAGAAPSEFDDLNQDGEIDPQCGTKGFGEGLVLQIRCGGEAYASEPSQGTTLVPGSLSSLPGVPDSFKEKLLTGVSANAVQARDDKGKLVVIFLIHSDTLFDVGSATLSEPAKATLDGLSTNIRSVWPAVGVQVRGHTDATGSPAANKTLSEQRAANVASYLAGHGFPPSSVTSVGLGSSLPLVLEKNPDGSDSAAGRHENRRVELVLHVPG